MNKFGLSEEHHTKIVSNAHIDVISRSHCKRWRPLHSYLEIEEIVVSDIDRNSRLVEEEDKRNKFFYQWKERKGSDATYQKLVYALLKTDCRQDAENVCKLLLADSNSRESISSPLVLPLSTAQTSAESFPYLENVPKEERRQLEARLRKESGNMINAFAMLVDKVNQSLKEQGVTGGNLRVLIKNSRYTVVYKAIKKQRDSLDEVMLKLSDYWSFFDYEVLELIIKCRCHELTDDLALYIEEFKNYCRRRLCEIPEGTLGVKAKCGQFFFLKCDENFSYRKSKLWDVKVLNEKLSELLETKLVLLRIHEGCLELKTFGLSVIPYPLTCQQKKTIEEFGIMEMRIQPKRNKVSNIWILRLTELMKWLGYRSLEEMTCKKLKEILDIDDEDCSEFLNKKIMEIASQILRPSQIFDYLYLGSWMNACDVNELENGVDYILDCSPHHNSFMKFSDQKYLKISLLNCSEDMTINEWNKAYFFLKESKVYGSKAMVICHNGIRESAATVVAYVMKEYKMSLKNALSLAKSKRNIVCLTAMLLERLKCYEQKLISAGQLESIDDSSTMEKEQPTDDEQIDAHEWAFCKWVEHQNNEGPSPALLSESAAIDKKKDLQKFFASLGEGSTVHQHVDSDADDDSEFVENLIDDNIAAEASAEVTHFTNFDSASDSMEKLGYDFSTVVTYSANLEDDMRSLGDRSVGSCTSRVSSIHSIGSTFSAA